MPEPFRIFAGAVALAALATTVVLATPPSTPDPVASAVSAPTAAAPGGDDRTVTPALPVRSSPGVVSPAATGDGVARAALVTYDWPLAPATVVRPFDDPEQPWLAGHRGVDLAGTVGARVLAAADGVVAFAGPVAGRGVVSIDHADGIRTTYEPVSAAVTRGQTVRLGDVVGTLDAGHAGAGGAVDGGGAGGAILHWGARTGPRTYVDPTLLVAGEVVIRLWE